MDYQQLDLPDILSLILRETNKETVNELLLNFPTVKDLAQALPEELQSIKGIGPSKANLLKASIELGKRLYAPATESPVIKSPNDVYSLLAADMSFADREQFRAIYLNTKNRVLHIEIISIGTLNSSMVHPRELYKNAIKRSAAALIIAHCHPSGDPTPSTEDKEITRRLIDAGKLLGMKSKQNCDEIYHKWSVTISSLLLPSYYSYQLAFRFYYDMAINEIKLLLRNKPA